MKKNKKRYSKFIYFIHNWITSVINPERLLFLIPRYTSFFKDWFKYSRIKGGEQISLLNTYPCIHEKTKTTKFDSHYFYQDVWAAKKIYNSKVSHHIDVGSRIDFVGLLTSFTKVSFVDIRPLEVELENFNSINGDVTNLPFEDNSIQSLSCLSVVEHIGLGRYGDELDAFGTKKACMELSRVLTSGGNLYLSLPIGKPRLCFNAMRIHSARQIINYFGDLKLLELSAVDDDANFIRSIDINVLENSNYACGLFWFKKEKI